MTLSTNKDKYGVRLRAEPDHMVLGKRLKGAFKLVMAAIKELKSEQLEEFQETGMWWYKPLSYGNVGQKKKIQNPLAHHKRIKLLFSVY